jgi:hypothetical protein
MAAHPGPCWKLLINDWYDGRIDGTYPVSCYTQALKHLPADVDAYSSAREDINAALKNRITTAYKDKNGVIVIAGGIPGNPNGPNYPSSGSPSGGGGGSGGGSSSGGSSSGERTAGRGPVPAIINYGRPSSADSVPIPLIVLAALALLLMAAGAGGFLMRRSRMRRLQLGSFGADDAVAPDVPPRP